MSLAMHTIEYVEGTDTRKIVISANDQSAMDAALKSDILLGKKKEALAKALAEALRSRTALLIERYKNDERHDAEDGEPAMVVLARGDFTYAESFTMGKSNKKLSPQELTDARWVWAKKHARPAPADHTPPGPGSSKIS